VAHRLVRLFERAGRFAFAEVGIKFGDRSTRIADVAVFFDQPDLSLAHNPPSAIALAVEIISPESAERDVGSKPKKYAAAGIPEFWLVERSEDAPADAVIHSYTLDSGAYVASSEHRLSDLEKTGIC